MSLASDLGALARSASILKGAASVPAAIEAAVPAMVEALLPANLTSEQRKTMLGRGGITLRATLSKMLYDKMRRPLLTLAWDMEDLKRQMDMLED
jgi:hypothetical protein